LILEREEGRKKGLVRVRGERWGAGDELIKSNRKTKLLRRRRRRERDAVYSEISMKIQFQPVSS
jgi:hypothetical protein